MFDDDDYGYDRDMYILSDSYRDMVPDFVFPELSYLKDEDEILNSSTFDDEDEEEESDNKEVVPCKRPDVVTYGTSVIRNPETFDGLTYDKLIKEEKDIIDEIKKVRAYAKEHPILFALKQRFVGYWCLSPSYRYLDKFL